MKQYHNFMQYTLDHGVSKLDRTGIGTISIFGYQMRFDLSNGFPIVTTKKLHIKSIIYELLWFLKGETNNNWLKKHGVSIWDEWANSKGELGPIYGHQWRNWDISNGEHIDQISQLIKQIKENHNSRRLIVSSWNVSDIPKMALPPCHILFQMYISNNCLSCQVYQRSADIFLGVPFNIASYSLLTHMIAQQTNYKVGELIWNGGDCHLYKHHLNQVKLQLSRPIFSLPTLQIKKKPANIFEYQYEDFKLINYKYHPAIHATVAV